MGILDEIKSEQDRDKVCGLGDALKGMDKESREQFLVALLDHETFQTTAICKTLISHGYKVNRRQITYCRKQCECGAIPVPQQKDVDESH